MSIGEGTKGILARTVAWVRRNWTVVRFCLVFGAILGAWSMWYPSLVDMHALEGLLEFVARLTASALRILGSGAEVVGTRVFSPEFSMRIAPECTSIVPMVILLSGVVAYPSPIRQKLLCLVIGLPVLFLLNLVRTVSLFYIGVHFPDFFETAHYVVWQSVMVLAVIAMWLFWIGRVVRARAT
jgi:exosortase H (IPTLxxWG-CTERM-specific)